MKIIRKLIVIWLCLFITITAGCGNENNKSTEKNSQDTKISEQIQKDSQKRQAEIEENFRKEQEEIKRKQEENEKKRQKAVNFFQYSDFKLYHEYNGNIPYNGVKMSFVVQNNSDSVQIVRLSDFVLQKKGSNTILPEKALRGHWGIAKNPENPDFSEYDNVLNQREIYPGDRFLVKIEFWEQRELIRSLEGWNLVHMYNGKNKVICKLQD